MAIVDVFDTSRLAQLGFLQPRFEPPVIALGQLAVDQQAQTFFEAQLADVSHVHLLHERLVHAVEPEALEFVEGGMV